MENTSPFLFDNVDERYFLAIKGRAIGPLTAQEVYERIQKGEAGLLHYFWREGWTDWKRVCDDREFTVLIPQKPTLESIQYIRKKLGRASNASADVVSGTSEETKNHYLYYNNSQYGPFSKGELAHILKTKKLGRSAYLWVPGWANWKRMAELAEYAEHFPKPAPKASKLLEKTGGGAEPAVRLWNKRAKGTGAKVRKAGVTKSRGIERTMGAAVSSDAGVDASERREAPRRPLVARLFLHNDSEVIIAVCRDISVGGMQVLTDRIPGPVGSMVKLNVSPGDPSTVKGFVAEGEIVRVLEDGRGFSFRFRKITEEARKTIERYIKD